MGFVALVSRKKNRNAFFSRPPHLKNDFVFFEPNFDPLKIRQHNIYPDQKHLRRVLRLKKNSFRGGGFLELFSVKSVDPPGFVKYLVTMIIEAKHRCFA